MVRVLMAVCLLAQAPAPATGTAYLFSYFTGNGEAGLHFARSTDGLTWTAADGNRSLLAPAVGSKLMRDRYGAIRSRDLKTWEPVAVAFPSGARHGTAFAVPDTVLR